MFPLVITTLIVAAIAGCALLWFGFRGLAIDDHPICRACRFDLVGVYPQAATCPECGADLGAPTSRRFGNRRCRWLFASLGAVLALASVAAGVAFAVASARGFDWNTIKPLAMLRWEAAGNDRAAAQAALSEVLKRVGAGRLDRHAAAGFVADALERQLDASNVRTGEWSTLFNAAHARGLTTPEEYARYLRQGVRVPVLRHPRRVRLGSPLHVSAGLAWGPFGRNPPNLRLVLQTIEVQAGGRVTPALYDDQHSDFRVEEQTGGSSSGEQAGGWPLQAAIMLDAGEHEIEVRAVVEVFEEGSNSAMPLATVTRVFRSTITVVDDSVAVVELVRDEAVRNRVRASIKHVGVRAPALSAPARPSVRMTRMFVQVVGDSPACPVQVFARVLVRFEGKEYWLGQTRAWGPGGPNGESHSVPHDSLPEKLPDYVDVILRPDPAGAERVGHDAIWGEDIVLESLPVVIGDLLGRPDRLTPPPPSK